MINARKLAASPALVVLGLVLTLAACNQSSLPTANKTDRAPSSTPIVTTPRDGDDARFEVSGRVKGANIRTSGDTVIVFQLDGSSDSSVTVVDSSGTFHLKLAPGDYQTSCVSLSGPCRADGGAEDSELSVSVRSSMTQNYTVTATDQDATSPSDLAPSETPEAAPQSESESCAAQGFTVCGHVFLDGRPARGITIEYKFRDANVSTTTNDSGAYGLKVFMLSSHAVCLTFNFDLDCGVIGSDGNQTVINGDTLGQIVDFRVCKRGDYPACLEP